MCIGHGGALVMARARDHYGHEKQLKFLGPFINSCGRALVMERARHAERMRARRRAAAAMQAMPPRRADCTAM